MSHVRVALRMKPATEADASSYVTALPPGTMMLSRPGEDDMFSFNFSHAMTCVDNEELHEVVGKPIVESVLEGYNATLLAYGQTGSGKTYSILGPESRISGDERIFTSMPSSEPWGQRSLVSLSSRMSSVAWHTEHR